MTHLLTCCYGLWKRYYLANQSRRPKGIHAAVWVWRLRVRR
jgi:hypothetical protein